MTAQLLWHVQNCDLIGLFYVCIFTRFVLWTHKTFVKWVPNACTNGDISIKFQILLIYFSFFSVSRFIRRFSPCQDNPMSCYVQNFHSDQISLFVPQWRHFIRFGIWLKIINGLGVNTGSISMMTSSNGHIFHLTGPLSREFTCYRWIPLTKASDVEHWCFLWSAPEQMVE